MPVPHITPSLIATIWSMNTRQETFVDHVVAGKSRTQAALDAGYSPSSAPNHGHRLMTKNDEVIKAVDARRRAIAAKADLSIADVIAETRSALETALEPNEAGDPRDLPSAVRLIKLLGDHVDAWAAGKAAPAQHLHLESLSFDELKQLASGDPE